MTYPWENWIPGVLSKRQLKEMCDGGYITSEASLDEALDLSSIDLSLSDEAFRMTHGSVKPSGSQPYSWFIEKKGLGEKARPSTDGTYSLAAKETYVFKLRERLERAIGDAGIHGQATAKSSVGRVDVLARLIVDGMDTYECFDPEGLKKQSGHMYVEITPITFPVKVKPGTKLSQLRLFYGDPRNVEMKGKELFKTVLHGPGEEDGSLSVDLTNVEIGGLPVASFYVEPEGAPKDPVPLWPEEPKPQPWRFWRFLESLETGDTHRLQITQNNFYLLRSKERLWVPRGIAIYCRASDETIGEMRIHYAGFVHPSFGTHRKDKQKGTPLIFEVRGHQVNVSLADGEKMANLIFYRMSEDCGEEAGQPAYENQSLQLSKFFADWSDKLRRRENGAVEPA